MLIAIILLPILIGVLSAVWKGGARKTRWIVLVALQAAETALVIAAAVNGGDYATDIWRITESLTVALRLDGVARLFTVLTACAWLVTLIFAAEYMKHGAHEPRFLTFLFITEGVLLGTALSADFVSMYVFYELTSLCSMPLVLHELTRESVTGAVKYLYYSIGGAFFVLFGIAVLYANTDTLNFAVGGTLSGEHTPLVLLAIFFVIIGFGTKAGVIGIIRVIYFIAGADTLRGTWVQTAGLILALFTVFMGSMMAYGEKDFKKRLAYSSISQISYVLTGLFILSPEGLEGGLLQVFFHAGAKIGLFLAAGAIIYLTGYRSVEDFRGLGRRMPVTFLALVFLALSLVGIPPFGGFFSKWHIALAALEALPGALAYIAPAVLLISALLTAGYLFTPIIRGFFPGEGYALGEPIREPRAMIVPLLFLAAVCGLLGFVSGPVTSVMEAIAGGMM